jgi:hypothetical protein
VRTALRRPRFMSSLAARITQVQAPVPVHPQREAPPQALRAAAHVRETMQLLHNALSMLDAENGDVHIVLAMLIVPACVFADSHIRLAIYPALARICVVTLRVQVKVIPHVGRLTQNLGNRRSDHTHGLQGIVCRHAVELQLIRQLLSSISPA